MSIPQSSQKRFLRLVSAHADMGYAIEAFQALQVAYSTPADYSLFLSMVVCYCRPFTESRGIGSLLCEYPDYPDWPDAEMNVRHHRMMDIRNNFLGHSCIEGSQVFLLTPGSKHPATKETCSTFYYAVAKRQFLQPEYVRWLYEIVDALFHRIDSDIRAVAKEIGGTHLNAGEIYEFDTRAESFTWTPAKRSLKRWILRRKMKVSE
jgi:hypothetical protein